MPCRIHTLLPDNGIQSAEQPRNRSPLLSCQSRCDTTCEANEVERRLAKPNHPWANGQVERTNRTTRDATPRRSRHGSQQLLHRHLELLLEARSHARRLTTLQGLAPAQVLWTEWPPRPDLLHHEPGHSTAELNS